jgi:hypothetical protein
VSTISAWGSTNESGVAGKYRSLGLALALASVSLCANVLQSTVFAEPAPVKVPLLTGSTGGGVEKPKIPGNAQIPADMLEAMNQLVMHEAKTMGGAEYTLDREIGRGKMNSCIADCFVILFLLEGVPSPRSKCSTQYMAVFTYIAGKPILLGHAQIGGRGLRYASIKSIGPDAIRLTTETYLPKDSIDKPSGKGHATYLINAKHLIETP